MFRLTMEKKKEVEVEIKKVLESLPESDGKQEKLDWICIILYVQEVVTQLLHKMGHYFFDKQL